MCCVAGSPLLLHNTVSNIICICFFVVRTVLELDLKLDIQPSNKRAVLILILCIHHGTLNSNYPKEDVFGRIETSCVDASSERRVTLADNSAGKTGDGALCDGSLLSLLASCYCVSHHKVYRTLSGTPNLQSNTVINQFHAYCFIITLFLVISYWHG